MLFLWVPLYCTGTCVSTTKDTDITHTVQTAACLSVSFSACFLSKLCSFYGFHLTVQALVSSTTTDTTEFKQLPVTSISIILCWFVACFKLCSFYGFHFTVHVLVSTQPPTLHTVYLPVSITLSLLLASSSALFMGATLFFHVLESTQPLLFPV